jgi:hypothetical protein
MRKKISVIGSGVKIAQDLSRIAEVGEDLHGADVVVVADDAADLPAIARSAPAATLVVTAENLEERCQQVCEGTLFPRARVVGIASGEDVSGAIESIVLERDDEHEVIALSDGRFGPHRVRLGRGGIRELI